VNRVRLSPGQWGTSLFRIDLDGRFAIFRNISKQLDETRSDFEPVPPETNIQHALERIVRKSAMFSQPRIRQATANRNLNAIARSVPTNVSAVSEANRRDSFGQLGPQGVRFRYSRLKEAALFAADAMGFQSTLVWKLLKSRVFAARSSNRNSLN
jgi:hypothetical protein